ncbi:glycosyltransferase family 9 protein [Corticimicrobacter populi]|uniref:ADP-heptose--LPS heptosyltransferase n=1 Tax=Corticimicrobacter populi TaxID=2175229 RepID=A0A2V1K0B1_9BURK|nr:glycosyltransferase family 9 protein [Corticimicrobacter populi]PWF23114.1 hypothetical protein DD235_08965 [Corticimicrobacter populi]
MKKAALLLRNREFYGANIVSLPVIYALKRHAEVDHLTVFASRGLQSFYGSIVWIDNYSEERSLLRTYLQVPMDVDVYYSMRPGMDGASLIGMLRRASLSIGLGKMANPLNRLFDQCYIYTEDRYRAVSYLLPVIDALKLPMSPDFYMREAMLDMAAGRMANRSGHVCMLPGAGAGEFKKWGVERFYELACTLHARYPGLVFDFIIGPSERSERQFLEAKCGQGLPFRIHENLGLADNAALMSSSVLVVANDCGPSHFAQCLQRPFIGLYFEDNPEWFFAHERSVALLPEVGSGIKSIPLEKTVQSAVSLIEKKQC